MLYANPSTSRHWITSWTLLFVQWTIDLTAGNLSTQWINSNGCKPGAHSHIFQALNVSLSAAPTTVLFVQSSALYAGGNWSAFSTQFPSPITKYVCPHTRFGGIFDLSFCRPSNSSRRTILSEIPGMDRCRHYRHPCID